MSAAENTGESDAKAAALFDHVMAGGSIGSAVGVQPETFEALYALACNHIEAKKYDEGIDIIRFIILYDHMNPRWTYALGVARQKKGDHAAALEAYGAATLLDPSDPRPQAQAGYCLMALGKLPEAKLALEGAAIACGTGDGNDDLRGQIEAMLSGLGQRGGEGKP